MFGDIGPCGPAGAIQEDALLCTAICFRPADWAECEFAMRYLFSRDAVRICVGWIPR